MGKQDRIGPDGISPDDLVVVAVGLTAGTRKRNQARRGYKERLACHVFLPWLPYFLGLRACAAWFSFCVRRQLAKRPQARLHLIAYLGGGVLVRLLHARGEHLPIERAVWNRGPAQERVASELSGRVPSLLLTLLGRRAVVDLARLSLEHLPFPAAEQGCGVIVEAEPSALARRLGIGDVLSDLSQKRLMALIPDASEAIAVPLSHDVVYTDPRFLDQAAAFVATGAFLNEDRTEIT